MKYVEITDTSYVRDVDSKAILNTDKKALSDYLMKKEIATKKQLEDGEIKNRLGKLEQDIQQIKDLLLKMSFSECFFI